MDRLACIDLPAFPLQLLCRRHPEWHSLPVAVVADDRPQGIIEWVNEPARRAGLLPGHRYAHGLSLTSDLRAGVVPRAHIEQGVKQVAAVLRSFSPNVEPSLDEPGVFWVDGSGLGGLYRSVGKWVRGIAQAVASPSSGPASKASKTSKTSKTSKAPQTPRGFSARICVGFTRFGTYAVARSCRSETPTIFRDKKDEESACQRVPLDRLDLDPDLRDTLARLGVFELGQFLRLPAGGLLRRFGTSAFRLHELAAGRRWDPSRYVPAEEPTEQHVLFDDPEQNVHGLVFAIKRALDPLLTSLATARQALGGLAIEFSLYRTEPKVHVETIKPAEPTLDARSILRLVHLRLESQPLPGAVSELRLTAAPVPALREQLALFRHRPQRSLRSADQAIAQIRAELGNDAVVKATLHDGHLPEAQYRWEPLPHATWPTLKGSSPRPLVRRIHPRPVLLPPQNREVRDNGWLLRGLEHGAVERLLGPYIVSGGWWTREIHREYHFAQTRRGDILWIYYDRRRRRWFLHGHIE